MPKVNRKGQAEVLSQEQLAQLWTELNQPHRLITQLAYYTASRISEVCALRAEDISAGKIVIRQSKTERTKEVVIVPPLRDAISTTILPTTGYLFPAAKWTRATVKRYRIQRHRGAASVAVTKCHKRSAAPKPPKIRFFLISLTYVYGDRFCPTSQA